MNIETTFVENYDKFRKQHKKQNSVNCNEHKATFAKFEVKLYSIEAILLKELLKLKHLILMGNNLLNVVLETNYVTKKYHGTTINLEDIKVF